MDNKEMKVLVGVVLIGLVAALLFNVFTKEVGATNLPFHTEWVNKGQPKWGSCVPNAACGVTEGTQEGSQAQECKLVQGSGSFPCAVSQKRSVEVSRSCEVETPACEEEPVDTCESEEGIQENGCTPVEEPETPPVVKKEVKKGNLEYSQGPMGKLGDGCVQFEWSTIKGSKNVRLKVSTDLQGMAFGKKYSIIETKDDGAETVCFPGAKQGIAKLRGDKSDTEYSDVEKFKL